VKRRLLHTLDERFQSFELQIAKEYTH
jgi:hypothetical protein